MPLNIPGIFVPFQLLVYPRLIVPSIVKDIRQIDFPALRRAGYRGAVFDKDNCLTLPHRDTLIPQLEEAWKSCRETFGEVNVLIVSNSAGTYLDAGGIQSEAVRYHLKVPVLFHKSFKPAYSCIAGIRNYFSSLPCPIAPHELIIVGDRLFTDVVMAKRLRMQGKGQENHLPPCTEKDRKGISTKSGGELSPTGPLAIWTTGVWERESMFIRWMERGLVNIFESWSPSKDKPLHASVFVKEVTPAEAQKRTGFIEELFSLFRGS